jgi:hypothetical protein
MLAIDRSGGIRYHSGVPKGMSRSGEIGRHATFRALCSNGHRGSSPLFGTPYSYDDRSSRMYSRLSGFTFGRSRGLTATLTATPNGYPNCGSSLLSKNGPTPVFS